MSNLTHIKIIRKLMAENDRLQASVNDLLYKIAEQDAEDDAFEILAGGVGGYRPPPTTPCVTPCSDEWQLSHTRRGHSLLEHEDFLECSCGATWWPNYTNSHAAKIPHGMGKVGGE